MKWSMILSIVFSNGLVSWDKGTVERFETYEACRAAAVRRLAEAQAVPGLISASVECVRR